MALNIRLKREINLALKSGKYMITIIRVSEEEKALEHYIHLNRFPAAYIEPALGRLKKELRLDEIKA